MYEELLAKAKEAKDEKELLAMAKKEGIDLTEDSVKSLFMHLHSEGELSEDELGDVSGGGCQKKINNHNFTVVTSACNCFTGKWVDSWVGYARCCRKDNIQLRETWYALSSKGKCGTCLYLEFDSNGIGVCGLTGATDTNKENW